MENKILTLNKRVDYIDLFRGIGILLMIMGHVGFGSLFYKYIHGFHMPMFFIISGYFYQEIMPMSSALIERIKKYAFKLLVPYFCFGLLYSIITIRFGGGYLIPNLFWVNTNHLPISDALYFLTAMFFAQVIFCILCSHIKYIPLLGLVSMLISIIGCILGNFLTFRIPWSLDIAMVGTGFLCMGYFIKLSSNSSIKLDHIKLKFSLLIGVVCSILVILNNEVNLRNANYGFIPLFYINAFFLTLSGLNISRYVYDWGLNRHFLSSCIKLTCRIGKDSISFLCLNQFFIFILNMVFVEINSTIPLVLLRLLELGEVVASCALCDYILRRTPLKVMIGIK